MDRYVNLTQTRSLLMYGGACNYSRVLTLMPRDGQTKNVFLYEFDLTSIAFL
jgi:hypothetical protein